MPDATELAILMALRVRGAAGATDVARAAGCAEVAAAAVLADLGARGLVAQARSGFVLDAEGRAELTRALAAEPIDRAALAAGYERFEAVDDAVKLAITRWQVTDEPGKRSAGAAVVAVARRAVDVADDLRRIAPRLSAYAGRLAAAATALGDGDLRFVASPRVDSLHQIWFELHEDLLTTLGRSRAA
jgi:hypothetical protein